jgi:RNA-binding protein 5/10
LKDAQAALAKFDALDRFTIASKPVLVSFIHAGVFIPRGSNDEDPRYSFAATINTSVRLAYWDLNAYASELMVCEAPPAGSIVSMDQKAKVTSAPSAEGAVLSGKDPDNKPKKRKAESSTSGANKKAMPSHLQFWKDRHTELHGGETKSTIDNKSGDGTGMASESKDRAPLAQSYADMTRKCCYLCSRQFKTEAEVNKHERLSQLHRDNLNNETLKTKAVAKLAKAGITPRDPASSKDAPTNDSTDYRDRAKERRAAYRQPKKPKPGKQISDNDEDHKNSEDDKNRPRASKGASLLGKMGWSEGQGLGAQGTGMVAPISTELYAEGVGLGAAGGKLGDAVEEADRRTKNGYEAFLEKTREGARGRFESLKE